MRCACDTHYCNGWTLNSLIEHFYAYKLPLLPTLLTIGQEYPLYNGPVQIVPESGPTMTST